MSTLVEIAREYFQLKEIGNNRFQIESDTGKFDSIVIFGDTNSYCRFSNRKSGGPKEFLHYIVGLPLEEIDITDPTPAEQLISTLSRTQKQKADTELSLQDVVGIPSYSPYIESRMISKGTAEYYHLEVLDGNVYIPLYDSYNKRVGSIVRNANAKSKQDRYKTYLVGDRTKPCCWRFYDLAQYRRTTTTIVLVEGCWSCMRIMQVLGDKLDIIPIATMGTALTPELQDYLSGKKIIAILDNDTGGAKVESTLKQWSITNKQIEIYVPQFVTKNASAMVDDLSDDDLLTLFRRIYRQSDLLKLKT